MRIKKNVSSNNMRSGIILLESSRTGCNKQFKTDIMAAMHVGKITGIWERDFDVNIEVLFFYFRLLATIVLPPTNSTKSFSFSWALSI